MAFLSREREYPTLTLPCTNALCKVWSIKHWVLLFCINTLTETKASLIGVNSIVNTIKVDIDISIVHVSKLITLHIYAAMNWTPICLGVSPSQLHRLCNAPSWFSLELMILYLVLYEQFSPQCNYGRTLII